MQLIEANPQQTFPKNVALAAVFGEKELTLRQQRAIHVICMTVREQFFLRNPHFDESNIDHVSERDVENTNTTFEVQDQHLMQAMGYTDKKKYYSMNQVRDLLHDLRNKTLYFDGLNIVRDNATREKNWTAFTTIVSSVEREDGKFRIHMAPKMVHRIVNPEISYLGPVSWDGYRTKYVPGIYETALYYWQSGKTITDWFSLDFIRRITGTNTDTYINDYNKLNKRVLQKSLQSINDADELDLNLQMEADNLGGEKRRGRKKITHVRFYISQKLQHLGAVSQVRNSIKLSSMQTELESLGIAKNSVQKVMEEGCDNSGKFSIAYMNWAIRRGHELRRLNRFNAKSLKNDDTENENRGIPAVSNFGGYFRKHILRGRKAEWFEIQSLLEQYIVQTSLSTSITDVDEELVKLRSQFKRHIAVDYLNSLTEQAFSYIKEDFVCFLARELPRDYQRYADGELGQSTVAIAEHGEFCMMIFLDYCHQIFTPEAFAHSIAKQINHH